MSEDRCTCEHVADDVYCPKHGGWPKSEDCYSSRHGRCDRGYCKCICHTRTGLIPATDQRDSRMAGVQAKD